MARRDTSTDTTKQRRQPRPIQQDCEERLNGADEADRRALATVTPITGGAPGRTGTEPQRGARRPDLTTDDRVPTRTSTHREE